MRRSVVLMGLRGSGKSTIGPMLASRLDGCEFRDLDADVLHTSGFGSIADIVSAEGWTGFRQREHEQLALWASSLLTEPECQIVLALGGGTPTHEPSRELLQRDELRRRATLVYLRATPGTLGDRMAHSKDRPSLTGADPVAEIRLVFDERDGLYKTIADTVIDVDELSTQDAVDAVLGALKQL